MPDSFWLEMEEENDDKVYHVNVIMDDEEASPTCLSRRELHTVLSSSSRELMRKKWRVMMKRTRSVRRGRCPGAWEEVAIRTSPAASPVGKHK
jgi:hypothetical protein